MEKFKFDQKISEEIFFDKYALNGEKSVEEVLEKVAEKISSKEKNKKEWKEKFYLEMKNKKLIPGGRILANARPNGKINNFSNCFVIDIEDDLSKIYDSIKEGALISKQGGGFGFNISKIRPKGDNLSIGGKASGTISFMSIFDQSAKIIMTGGLRRCLPEFTYIHTENGLKYIKDIQVNDKVLTSEGYEIVKNIFNQGKQPVITIKTSLYDFKCTKNHKMAVSDGIGNYIWKKADDLNLNDRLVFVSKEITGIKTQLPPCTYIKPLHSTTCKVIIIPELDSDMAWFFGYLHGNGYVKRLNNGTKGVVSISCPTNREEIITKVCNQLLRFGIKVRICKTKGNWVNIRVSSKVLALYLSDFKQPNTNIEIPSFIKNSLVSIRSAYLAGLFDADGSCLSRPVKLVSTVYPNFAEEIKNICFSLGIPVILKKTIRKTNKWKSMYDVTLSYSKAVEKFELFIQSYSLKYVNFRKKSFLGCNHFDITYSMETFKKCSLYKWDRRFNSCNEKISLATVERVTEKEIWLLPIDIQEIEKNDIEEINTFDIEVENKHEFVANGFLTHNSAILVCLNVDHPDIEEFITCKQGDDNKALTQMNISVGITDKFMEAVEKNNDWDLVFNNKIYKTVKAKYLYDLLCNNAFHHNEPGILNLDIINKYNNAYWYEDIVSTNPCFPDTLKVIEKTKGIILIKDLNIGDVIFSEDGWVNVINKISNGIKPVNRYHTTVNNYKYIDLTENHKINQNGKKIQVKEAKSIDCFALLTDEKKLISFSDDITKVENLGDMEVWDITVDGQSHTFWGNNYNIFNCGEITLLPYEACNLTSINLTSFVVNPFTENAFFDKNSFIETIKIGVRFLDNVIDLTEMPLDKINKKIKTFRKSGLGFTGLGDMFAMLRIKYGSEDSKNLSLTIAKNLRDESYKASIYLAKEKGCPKLIKKNIKKILESNFIIKLPEDIRLLLKKYGIRNIALNMVAPTGTTSFSLGNNCSSGIEPIFALEYTRTIRANETESKKEKVYDYAYLLYKKLFPNTIIPNYFVTITDINSINSIDIQSIFQEYIDNSISKTLNISSGTKYEEYNQLFKYAYKKGLKGFTTFNPDGCGSPQTKIITRKGIKTFEEIFKENGIDIYDQKNQGWHYLKEEIEVYDKDGKINKVNKVFMKGLISNMINITLENGKILCVSPEHKFLINNVWIKTKNLKEGDDLDVYQGKIG